MEQPQPERRSEQRFAVDAEATVVMVNQGSRLRGRLTELSLEGCRLRADRHWALAAPASIEVMFKLNGIDFRLGGTMQWADARQMAGIQFSAMAPRRRDFLMELLSELEAEEAPKAEVASEPGAAEPAADDKSGKPDGAEPEGAPIVLKPAESPVPAPQKPAAVGTPSAPASRRERRTQSRHLVDSRATIFFVEVRAEIAGRILDVSLGGCRIRTDERFPVGIYRRVETEFTVDGVPLRLAGVVQSVHDRFTVGIRFLDMSERKRTQLTELIEEMDGMKEQGTGNRE